MSQHTPGPWVIRYSKTGYPYQITAPNGNRGPGGIVDVTRWAAISMPSSDEGQANANLIATAPDLLAALREIAAIEDEQWGGDWEEIERARQIAGAAIAKAEGKL